MDRFREAFRDLCAKSIEEQGVFFRERFAFRLGKEKYIECRELEVKFKEFLKNDDGTANSMSPAVASNFIQKNSETRTAAQRNAELADVDANKDGRLSFIEFCLLHYKTMVLTEFFERKKMSPDVEMGNNGVGLVGVGDRLIEELMAFPQGVDPELEDMIANFAKKNLDNAAKIAELEEVVAAGGVKGMSAKNELAKLKPDEAEQNAIQARIENATVKAKKKAKEQCGKWDEEVLADGADKNAAMKAGLAAKKGAFHE